MSTTQSKTILVQYFAALREQRGCDQEQLETNAQTPLELYQQLKASYGFVLPSSVLKVAVNGDFAAWQHELQDQDEVVFIQPVSGG